MLSWTVWPPLDSCLWLSGGVGGVINQAIWFEMWYLPYLGKVSFVVDGTPRS